MAGVPPTARRSFLAMAFGPSQGGLGSHPDGGCRLLPPLHRPGVLVKNWSQRFGVPLLGSPQQVCMGPYFSKRCFVLVPTAAWWVCCVG